MMARDHFEEAKRQLGNTARHVSDGLEAARKQIDHAEAWLSRELARPELSDGSMEDTQVEEIRRDLFDRLEKIRAGISETEAKLRADIAKTALQISENR